MIFFQQDSSRNFDAIVDATSSTIKLKNLIPLLERNLLKIIDQERKTPSYTRARLSNGGIKEEGMLREIRKIEPHSLAELLSIASLQKNDEVEEYIAFLSRCARIETLANQQRNLIVKIQDSPQAETFTLFSNTASFFPYNGEGITDYGWGCCWRATQTTLSAVVGEEGKLEEVPTFEALFHLFGSNAVLKKIYIDFLIVQKGVNEEDAHIQAESLFAYSKFSPYQHAYGWSNPFVSQLIFHYYSLNSEMFAVNGIPIPLQEEGIPDHLLEGDIDFSSLSELLVHHFSTEKPLPVVIDDGKFAMAIVGIKVEGDRTEIWFADPHIKGGANHPETAVIYDDNHLPDSFRHVPDSWAGLYSVTFDSCGNQIDHSVARDEVMFSRNSYQETQFRTKPWMLTLPTR